MSRTIEKLGEVPEKYYELFNEIYGENRMIPSFTFTEVLALNKRFHSEPCFQPLNPDAENSENQYYVNPEMVDKSVKYLSTEEGQRQVRDIEQTLAL